MFEFLDYARENGVGYDGEDGTGNGLNRSNVFRLDFRNEVPSAAQEALTFYLGLPKPEIVMDTDVVQVENYQKVYERDG